MGFLDKRGVKKLVNWVKDKLNNISIPETGQPVWEHITKSLGNKVYLYSYEITKLEYVILNASIWFDENRTPDENKEYKLISKGIYLNYIKWPSVFDMSWPNNKIPDWESDHEYEIYIAGGRVVSIDDITPPVEEVTYTIETYNDKYLGVRFRTKRPIVLIDGEVAKRELVNYKLPNGTHTILLQNLEEFEGITIYEEDNQRSETNDYIISKVDCSKMKSNNLHNALEWLKVDEIIYPQSCIGKIFDPVYEFEAPEVDLRCLSLNELYYPSFNFKTDNFIGMYIDNIWINYDTNLFGENISNIDANKILLSIGNKINSYSEYNLSHIKTVGTLYDCIYINAEGDGAYGHFKFCNLNVVEFSYFRVGISADEIIFHAPTNIESITIYSYTKIAKVFIENLNNINYSIIYYNGARAMCTIYYIEGDPSKINISAINGASINFIKVNSVEEVPFQYAPTSWDDVKNYDEDGNVIE